MLETVEIVCFTISFGSNHKMTGLLCSSANKMGKYCEPPIQGNALNYNMYLPLLLHCLSTAETFVMLQEMKASHIAFVQRCHICLELP